MVANAKGWSEIQSVAGEARVRQIRLSDGYAIGTDSGDTLAFFVLERTGNDMNLIFTGMGLVFVSLLLNEAIRGALTPGQSLRRQQRRESRDRHLHSHDPRSSGRR